MPRPEFLWVAPIIWLISILQNVDVVTVGNLSCKQSIRAVTPFLLLISDLIIFVSKGFGTDRSGYGNQPEVVCKYSLKNWFMKKEKQDSLFWKILKSECTQTEVLRNAIIHVLVVWQLVGTRCTSWVIQPPVGVLWESCSEKFWKIYSKTSVGKCNLTKNVFNFFKKWFYLRCFPSEFSELFHKHVQNKKTWIGWGCIYSFLKFYRFVSC